MGMERLGDWGLGTGNERDQVDVPIWFSTNQRVRCFQVLSSFRFNRRTRTTLLPEVCM